MRALVLRRRQGSAAIEVEELGEPVESDTTLLVEGVALGICGTDRRLLERKGRLADGTDRLIVGHESLGRVLRAPAGSGWSVGELVVGVVRQADPAACWYCKQGQWDLCEGDYAERGISGADGFGAERYCLEPEAAVRVGPLAEDTAVLLEPASIVAKAWEVIERHLQWRCERVAVLGAGPIGQLAALFSVQRGCETNVVDQVSDGPKPRQVEALGASYHTEVPSLCGHFDVVLECSGALVREAVALTASGGVCCLIGGGESMGHTEVRLGALARDVMMLNRAVIGVMSSNRHHFEVAVRALSQAPAGWLPGLIGPSVPLEDWRSAFEVGPREIKAVISLPSRGNGAYENAERQREAF